MAVIGPELPRYAHISALIVLLHIKEPFGYHQRNDVIGVTESGYLHIHHVKALSENLVAECKVTHDFPHDDHLVVFNYLICHFLFSLLGLRFDRNRF